MAETGIGLSASEYYFQADGFIDDLKVATDTEVAYWTQGYNGGNSRIPVTAGEFIRLNFNLWIPEATPNKQIFDFSGAAAQQCDVSIGADGLTLNDQTYFDSVTVNGTATRLLKVGFNAVKIVMTEHRSIDMIGADAVDFLRSFQGQLSAMYWINENGANESRFYPGIICSNVDPDATDIPMPSSTVLVDEWSEDGSTNGTMINFGTTQPYVPLLGDREEYWAGLADGDWKRGVNLAEQRFTMNGSSSGRQGSLPNNINQTTMPIQSLLVASNVTVKVGEIVNNMAIVFDSNGNSDDSIQHAFQYPNTFKVIKPTDPDHPDFR